MELDKRILYMNTLVANFIGNNFLHKQISRQMLRSQDKRKNVGRYNFEAVSNYCLDFLTRHKFSCISTLAGNFMSNTFIYMQKSPKISRLLDNHKNSGQFWTVDLTTNAIFLKMELDTEIVYMNILVANSISNNFVYKQNLLILYSEMWRTMNSL